MLKKKILLWKMNPMLKIQIIQINLWKPTIDGFKDSNMLINLGNKFGINAIVFQDVNTSSGIFSIRKIMEIILQ